VNLKIAPLEKDYYSILGINSTATPEQIKDAYRLLAKKFHPDVRSAGDDHEPNQDKFRDVAEAYAVLSVRESRVTYDLARKKNPDLYK
jgi:DnaJ-class molecular chaperone